MAIVILRYMESIEQHHTSFFLYLFKNHLYFLNFIKFLAVLKTPGFFWWVMVRLIYRNHFIKFIYMIMI